MRKLLGPTTFLCCVGGIVLLGLFWRSTAQPGQVKPGTTITDRPKRPWQIEEERKLAELPIVDFTEFDPAASTDPRRAAKNARYNLSGNVDGPPARKLEENMDTVFSSLPMTHWPAEPAFPLASDVIVLGTVREAKAYLSMDRTNVYSEVSLSIEEILKADQRYELQVKGTVSANRRGGAVRFPSGKIVRCADFERAVPTHGRRYLLFLKDAGGGELSIVTGYELAGDRVIPLDGLPGSNVSIFANYEKLRNTSEDALLDAVRKAIREKGSGEGGKQ